MNPQPENSSIRSQSLLTALFLTGIVSIGSGFIVIKSSIAANSPLVIKKDTAKFSGLPNLRIIALESWQKWNGSCEGVSNCTRPLAPNWQATVSNGRDSYVYRVKQDGSQFKLQGQTGTIETVKPVPIAASELPPPLDRGELFREIASGRNSGRTYQTVLLNDGLLMRVRIGDANDSERIVYRVSPKQLRLFKALLKRSGAQFNNLNYQVKTGSADYISYTLTSHDGTVRYSDLSSNGLPANLRVVVEAWNQLRGVQEK